MKMKLLFLMSLMFSSQTFANCTYSLTTPVFNYAVSDNNPTTSGTVSILRTLSNSGVCDNFFLAFTKGWAGNYNRRAQNLANGDLIYYNLYKNNNTSGVLKEPSDITSVNEVLFGTIAKNQTLNLTYYFTLAPISASFPPRAGTYVDVIQVQAYSGTYTNINSFEGTRDLNITLMVPKFISLSLADTGGAYDAGSVSKTLDFGALEQNETLGFDIRVVSNAGYILKASSINNGLLKRAGGSGANSNINYVFYANNSAKSLTASAGAPVTLASGTGRTAAGGAVVPIRVVIGSTANKVPGTYQDYLTLSVISND